MVCGERAWSSPPPDDFRTTLLRVRDGSHIISVAARSRLSEANGSRGDAESEKQAEDVQWRGVCGGAGAMRRGTAGRRAERAHLSPLIKW